MPWNTSQLQLILWKDYLVRKRKPITLGGIVWACMTILSLVIVRFNVDPINKPTCQFKARALPSAGALPFLQSFICTINNECEDLEKFEDIPSYENSRLKKYQKQFQPIIENETIIEVAQMLPNSAKLLALITNVIDDPEIHHIVRDGLYVAELFKNPEHVKKLLNFQLNITNDVADAFLMSKLTVENVLNVISSKNKSSCHQYIADIFITKKKEDLLDLAKMLCSSTQSKLREIAFKLVYEINVRKYLTILGESINKLGKTNTIRDLFNLFSSLVQLTDMNNYIPKEISLIQNIFSIKPREQQYHTYEFSYINTNLIYHMISVTGELFNETEVYKTLISTVDFFINCIEEIESLNMSPDETDNLQESESSDIFKNIGALSQKVELLTSKIHMLLKRKPNLHDNALDVFIKLTEYILSNFSKENHDTARYYLTIFNDLIIGTHNILSINLHTEEIMYKTLLRHPNAIKKIEQLGPSTIGKIVDALADSERIQMLTRKIFHPGQMFCDTYKLQVFFKVSKIQANKLKPILCDPVWKSYSSDVIDSFGVYNISKTINKMTSLVIAKTLGKDVETEYIEVKTIVQNVYGFIKYVVNESVNPSGNNVTDWEKIFPEKFFDEISGVLKSRENLTDVALVTIHTALAREVISSSTILESYITPLIVQVSIVLKALNKQLETIPTNLFMNLKNNIVMLTESILATLNDKSKMINILTSNHEYVFCGMVENCEKFPQNCSETLNNNDYIVFSQRENPLKTAKLLCNISSEINKKLNSDLESDIFFNTIKLMINDPEYGKTSKMNWSELINVIQKIYLKLSQNFGYLFELNKMIDENVWQNIKELSKNILSDYDIKEKLSVKLSFDFVCYVFNIMDSKIFEMNKLEPWLQIKTKVNSIRSLFYIADNIINLFSDLMTNSKLFSIDELPSTSRHISTITEHFPNFLYEITDVITLRQVNIDSIISIINGDPRWPCSELSMGSVLNLTSNSSNVIISVEYLLCVNDDLQNEWENFSDLKKLETLGENITENTHPNNLFLKTAKTFNSFVEDFHIFVINSMNLHKEMNNNSNHSTHFGNAWKYLINNIFKQANSTEILRNMFKNIDTILMSSNEVLDENMNISYSTVKLWENALSCNRSKQYCKQVYWFSAKYLIIYFAEAGQQIINDLTEYTTELLEPEANALQFIGFTKKTGPYILYSKLPEFIDTLMNSFLDQGFMKQLYRSIGRKFWDCGKVLDKLAIPVVSNLKRSDVDSLKPYICPSLVYWVSVPTDENTLLDIFAKSQFLFYSTPVEKFSAKFEKIYHDVTLLRENMIAVSNSNATYTLFSENWIKRVIDISKTISLYNYNSTKTMSDNMFETFYVLNAMNLIYVNNIAKALNYYLMEGSKLNIQNYPELNSSDSAQFIKLLEKKPLEVIELFVFAITEELRTLSTIEDFDVVKSIRQSCNNETYLSKDVMWLKTNVRIMKQFCKTNYESYIELVQANKTNDFMIREFFDALFSLNKITDSYSWKEQFETVIGFKRSSPGDIIKLSTLHAKELGLKGFIDYLDIRLKNYNVVFSFITGEDWWQEVKTLYNSTHINLILKIIEKSLVITENLFLNMADIKIVRLIKDIQINNTNILCQLPLSDYIPDSTGLLTDYRNYLCNLNETKLFKEIPSLRIAAQTYDPAFKINSTEENNNDKLVVSFTEKILKFVKFGPQNPLPPTWLDPNSILHNMPNEITSETSKINIGFFVVNNAVDAMTLFINSSFSPISSMLTPWVKQISLQFIKNYEYTSLICELDNMNDTEIYASLVENFHWNLALSEVVSVRNYTWIELNKALNELFDHVRYYLHNKNAENIERLSKCLINKSGNKLLDDIALYLNLGAKVFRLVISSAPYFKDVKGIKSNPTIIYYSKVMNKTIPVYEILNNIIKNKTMFYEELKSNHIFENEIFENDIDTEIDLNKVVRSNYTVIQKSLKYTRSIKSNTIFNVSNYISAINKNLDIQYLTKNIKSLREISFWSFQWLSNILIKIEKILINTSHILQLLGALDWNGLNNQQLNSTIDFIIQISQKNYAKSLATNFDNILLELQPLFESFEIGLDLDSVVQGLYAFTNIYDEVENVFDMKFNVQIFFRDWDEIKYKISNETKLSIRVLNTIEHSIINIKPLLTARNNVHIMHYICNIDLFSKIFTIKMQSLSQENNYASLKEVSRELCILNNNESYVIANTMLQKLNFTTLANFVMDIIVKQAIYALDIPEEEGRKAINSISKTTALMPTFKDIIINVTEIAKYEPLLQTFQNSSSLSDLLSKSNFLEEAGKLMCGKPFQTNINRFYRVIAQAKDNIIEPDKKQLESLPTDYCRGLYKEILSMGGGKILWTYAKPLLMGRILYTPDNVHTRKIITHANETFLNVGKLTTLLHDFSHVFTSLDIIIDHKESLRTMQKLLQSSAVKALFEKFSDGQFASDINISDLVNEFGDSKVIKSMVKRISQMANCINLDRFLPTESETNLEKHALKLMEINEFMAGIVFLNAPSENKNFQYKIRMDIDNVPSTSRIKHQFWMPGPNADFIENLRYFRGFVQLQDLIDKSIIKINNETKHSISKRSIQNKTYEKINNWSIYTQQMPYPCYVKDDFKTILYESQALIIAFFFSMILVVASFVRHLIWERESGNTSLMHVMGMSCNTHTFSWFISSMLEMIVTMIAMCVILKFGNILPKSNPLLILIILLNFGVSVVMFCYMVTSMFRSASLGAVSAVIFYLICFLPYVLVISLESLLTFAEKMLTSVFMSSGFSYGVLLIARFEVQGVGLQWYNFNTSPLPDDSITVMSTFFILIFDSILYGVIGYIVNNIRFKQNIYIEDINTSNESNESKLGVKIDGITKIYKNGKISRKALDNVTINLKKGNITTLLGHNGAGKTTLINILMGITKPSSGNVIINKLENNTTKERDTNHIGLCPQSDVLIETMTAKEHLIYYAKLKTKLSYDNVKYDVDSMVDIMGLGKLAYEPVYRLSGGLRRRLCVGLAFIANPYLVVLDEPSSGVDPVARRDIWSLIVGLKQNRTILLTTHHLDEAELLSDTLVIMHKGKVLTSGSPLTLKHQYGDGYRLTVTYPSILPNDSFSIFKELALKNGLTAEYRQINESEDGKDRNTEAGEIHNNLNDLIHIIKEYIPNAVVNDVYGNVVIFSLPYLDVMSQQNNYFSLIQKLENSKQELKYYTISMDGSSMEQVFLKICKAADNTEPLNTNNEKHIPNKGDRNSDSSSSSSMSESISNDDVNEIIKDVSSEDLNKDQSYKGTAIKQMMALLQKRFLHYRRNYRLLIITLVLPAVFVALAMGFSLIRPPADSESPINLTPALYNKFSAEFVSLHHMNNLTNEENILNNILHNSIEENNRTVEYWTENSRDCICTEEGFQVCEDKSGYSRIFTPPEKQIVILPTTNHTVRWIVDTEDTYTEKRYGGWSVANTKKSSKNNDANFIAWYNNKGDHALPSYINTLNNAILKYNTKDNENKITTYSHPLKLSVEQLSKSTLLQHIADVGIAVILLVGFSLVPAASCIYLVKERTNQEKRLQLLCGVTPFIYWISSLLWDVLIIILATVVSIIVFEIFSLPVFVARQNLPAICLLLLLYGFSCSSLTHILEKMFNDASLANMILFCLNVFIGVIGLTILLIIDVLSKSQYADDIRWLLHKLFMIFPQFALGDGLVEISKNTIQATVLQRFGMDTYLSPLGWELMGIHYVALTLTTLFFFFVNLAYEYNLLHNLINRFRKHENPGSIDDEMEDCDVATERYRVELSTMKAHYNTALQINEEIMDKMNKMHNNLKTSNIPDTVQVIALRKVYKGVTDDRVAVENLTFGIKNGQCFGLLGVNGAGKSTTFKMLTGEDMPTRGEIYINGKAATSQDVCNGLIAYCPQTDALDSLITLKEHLEFYCKLRNIINYEKEIKKVLHDFDLVKYANQQAETLSGGNKRKLCTAISLMGKSPIVLLDEPTSGMDPGARYRVGLVIKKAVKNGRCLLLSSHSLIECESLCQVAGVMSLGKFVALGSPSYLKHRYGGGYLVSIRLASPDQKGQLMQNVYEMFPSSKLQSSHYCTSQFLIPIMHQNATSIDSEHSEKNNLVNTQLSDIFKGITVLQNKLDIMDYSINQSSLDQVFINFSNHSNIKKNCKSGQIKLSTLERHYSKTDIESANDNDNIYVTKF